MNVYDKLGLFEDLNPCDSDYVGKLNFNFKALDSISFGVVVSIVSSLPTTANDQDVYILNNSGSYSFYFFDDGKWQELEVRKGVSVFIESENWYHYFDGTGFVPWPQDGTADIPIHSRPEAVEVNDPDLFLIEQGGQKKKITALNLQDYFGGREGGSITMGMLTQAVIDNLVPIGTVITSLGKTAPSGYIDAGGVSIGPDGSGADYMGDTYKNIYDFLWQSDFMVSYSLDHPLSITGGKGTSSNDDWLLGRVIRINLKLGNSFPRFGNNVGEYSGDTIRDIGGQFSFFTNRLYSIAGYQNPYEDHAFHMDQNDTVTATIRVLPTDTSPLNRPATLLTTTYDPTKNEGVVMGSEFKPKSITYNVFVKY